MKCKAYLNNHVNNDGTSIVYLRYYLNGKQRLKTGLNCEPSLFNTKDGYVKASHPKAEEYNLIIDKCKGKFNDIQIRAKLAGVRLTPQIIESEYDNPSTLKEFYPWVVSEIKRKNITEGTKKAYLSIAKKFNKFAPGILFSDFDTLLIEQFDKYMMQKKDNEISTRANAHKRMKEFLTIAESRKMISEHPYDHFKIRKGDQISSKVYLTNAELTRFINLYENGIINNDQRKVLRGFLFQCYTGLRFCDLVRVKNKHLNDNMLIIKMQKSQNITGRIVRIPLSRYALKLIDDSEVKAYGEIFKHFTDNTTREYLKVLALKARIKKNVTTHVGRHTFGTLFYEATKDLLTLKELLGHSDIRQTLIYAHLTEKTMIDQMKLFGDYI